MVRGDSSLIGNRAGKTTVLRSISGSCSHEGILSTGWILQGFAHGSQDGNRTSGGRG